MKHDLATVVDRYKLNTSNFTYIDELVQHLETRHPLDFLRKKLSEIDSSLTKLPASRFSTNYWKIRGYDEDEARSRVSYEQGKNGSFEHKREKMLAAGTSEEEAEKKIRELATRRGEINSNSHKHAQEKDSTYLRSMSHHCKEFWLKKGYSEDESTSRAAESCEKNRKRFREKLDAGEIEKGWNNTTIEYYLKKGMSVDEAKLAIIDRQKTFSLDKCVAKWGKEVGVKKWKDRQRKWKDLYYSGAFSTRAKDGNSFSKPATLLFNKLFEFFPIAKYKSNEWYIRDKTYFFFDFTLVDKKKIIEFNGDYWHCNPTTYSPDFFHTIKKMTAQEIWEYDKLKENVARSKGYDFLTVWEKDFKQNPEHTINLCKEFLNA